MRRSEAGTPSRREGLFHILLQQLGRCEHQPAAGMSNAVHSANACDNMLLVLIEKARVQLLAEPTDQGCSFARARWSEDQQTLIDW